MLVEELARTPGTALHREMAGDDWTLDQHLLALVVDRLAWANWQRQGKKNAKKPDPISPLAKRRRASKVGESGEHSDDEVLALLERYRTGVLDGG